MIAVIQCATTKRPEAGFFRKKDGTPVLFVADPAAARQTTSCTYARPDDPSDRVGSWREALLQYNASPGNNPMALFPACELYENPVYRRLAEHCGARRTYILSAGWGLIRADFLTARYDITFSQMVKQKAPYKLRRKRDLYDDLCQLPADNAEPIVFFGGNDYVPLFCKLTALVKSERTVFHYSAHPPRAPGCRTQRFRSDDNRRWHYECASAFIHGRLPID